MRILYGVVGEGMGHATRSRVILEHLITCGHTVRVVVSGRAHAFLSQTFAGQDRVSIEEIHGLHLVYDENAVDKSESLIENLHLASDGIKKNIAVYRKVAEDGFSPEVVISDFESWAYLYARNHRLPVISIDNMQVINRCHHPASVTGPRGLDAWIARLAVKIKMPGAYHYLVTSFFFPRVRKRFTTLVPPILRREILEAKRESREHVLVYQTAASNRELVPALQKLPYDFFVYGLRRSGEEGNVHLRDFSPTGFVEDLRTARAVITGGGYSLIGEAVHLRVPVLSVPVERQYEQELNARYLDHLGYGTWTRTLDLEVIHGFLRDSDKFAHNLESYQPRDNSMVLGCVDELLQKAAHGERRPVVLDHESMGQYR
jgi:uncharacterized protein (TIGR00661 family)